MSYGRKYEFDGQHCSNAIVDEDKKETTLFFLKKCNPMLTIKREYDPEDSVVLQRIERPMWITVWVPMKKWTFTKVEFTSIGQDADFYIVKLRYK